ncbi:MAG: histidine kinase [Bacteroidales bacterium]|nr:histidine kinase [Bacteroidales bacterium]
MTGNTPQHKGKEHKLLHPFGTPRLMRVTLASAAILCAVMVMGNYNNATHSLNQDFHPLVSLTTMLLNFLLVYTFNFWIVLRIKRPAQLLLALLVSLVTAGAMACASYAVEQAAYGCSVYTLPVAIIIYSTTAMIAYLVTLLLFNVTRQQRLSLQNEQLQGENLRIQMDSLMKQMSPHFLFNSLNTLDALIGTDDGKAHQYLHKLAATYRYALEGRHEVSLADEMEFTHNYLYMMSIRYGESLRVSESIDPRMLALSMVPISVQLLVENAIKHNVATTRAPLPIEIGTTADGKLVVSNPIRPKSETHNADAGIGLGNLSKRYSLQFGREITIENDGTTFAVKIPLI